MNIADLSSELSKRYALYVWEVWIWETGMAFSLVMSVIYALEKLRGIWRRWMAK